MEHPNHHHPERPLECSECKRPVKVHYTEIIGDQCTKTGMCEVCPQLQKRLKGTSYLPHIEMAKTGLSCGECGTSLDSVRMGNPLGCPMCYSIFSEILLQDMIASKTISGAIGKKRKNGLIHIGRAPGEIQEISPTLQLIALNEALTETLAREDYEQAAWLRDQIKAITDEEGGKKNE
jgi:protein arginine kinase activator